MAEVAIILVVERSDNIRGCCVKTINQPTGSNVTRLKPNVMITDLPFPYGWHGLFLPLGDAGEH